MHARDAHPADHLYYRLKAGGEKCWYSPKAHGQKVAKVKRKVKKSTRHAAKPVPAFKPATKAPTWTAPPPRYRSDLDNDGLDGAITALCGDPCPLLIPFDTRWDQTRR